MSDKPEINSIDDIPQVLIDKIVDRTIDAERESIRKEESAKFAQTLSKIEGKMLKASGYSRKDVANHFELENTGEINIEEHVVPFLIEKTKDVEVDDSELKKKLQEIQDLKESAKEQFEQEITQLKSQLNQKDLDFENYKTSQSLNTAKQNRFKYLQEQDVIASHIDFDIYEVKLQKHLNEKGYQRVLKEGVLTIVDSKGKQINDGKDYIDSKEFELDFVKNNELIYKRGDKVVGGSFTPNQPMTAREKLRADQRAAINS